MERRLTRVTGASIIGKRRAEAMVPAGRYGYGQTPPPPLYLNLSNMYPTGIEATYIQPIFGVTVLGPYASTDDQVCYLCFLVNYFFVIHVFSLILFHIFV